MRISFIFCNFARYFVKQHRKTMYRTIKQVFLLSLVALLSVSCVTKKKMTYVRDANAGAADSINAKFQPQSETVIRSGDALTFFVSALDQEAVAPYNLAKVTYDKPGTNQVQTTPSVPYYIVDEAGEVELPVLGKVHVAGLKRAQVEDTIKSLLEKQVLNPMVHVDLVDAKVTVLGEVKNPGRVPLTRGRLTIFEALAAVGDLTPYGRREDVLLTREVDGKLEFARLDLGDVNLYASPYYYLQQNDVLYVSPNGVRVVQSSNVGLWLSMVSTVASAATVIVTVVSLKMGANN